MILPFGFFSRPMTEPANVRTNPDAPSANQAQERTSDLPIRLPPPSIPWQRYPSVTANRARAIDARVATAPAAEATRPYGPRATRPRPGFDPILPSSPAPSSQPPPSRGSSRIPGGGGGGAPAGGGRTIDTTAYPTPSGGGGGGSGGSAGSGSSGEPGSSSGITDAEIVQILNALADGTAPAEYQQYLEALIEEAVKRGLPVPAKFRSMIQTGTTTSTPQVSSPGKGAGSGVLLLAGAGGGFLVGGPVGAAIGAAAALLLGRK